MTYLEIVLFPFSVIILRERKLFLEPLRCKDFREFKGISGASSKYIKTINI